MRTDKEIADELQDILDADLGVLRPGPHMARTPERLLRYLKYWQRSTGELPFKFTAFENVDPVVDQMVVIGPITFWSCCSHHLLPFFGNVVVGYLPDAYIVGLSKVAQLVRHKARKPQVQEHLAHEIAYFLERVLVPHGVAVYIKAIHTCQMMSVGPDVPPMQTTVLRGDMHKPRAQAEFLSYISQMNL